MGGCVSVNGCFVTLCSLTRYLKKESSDGSQPWYIDAPYEEKEPYCFWWGQRSSGVIGGHRGQTLETFLIRYLQMRLKDTIGPLQRLEMYFCFFLRFVNTRMHYNLNNGHEMEWRKPVTNVSFNKTKVKARAVALVLDRIFPVDFLICFTTFCKVHFRLSGEP
ncbi:hypothetical protein HOLleu_31456 [Holothuria leucospilota]|uniref:Uncharacterized protein n=1 Tax=Holothuria leucospilota TaxID=206669 RepID=A0A9Q0YS82_HOLLE|nr:hypothetical protein HOLleu_31456 [Holothuria leucospilota]